MKTLLSPWIGLAIVLAASAVRAQPLVTFAEHERDVEIRIGDRPFATYVWRDDAVLRPYFMDLRSPRGIRVTRNQPPIEGQDATDHPAMHPGLWLAFGDLAGADFWRNQGRVEHVEFVERPESSADGAHFTARYRYVAGESVVCEEVRRIEIRAADSAYWIDWISDFTAPRELTFGDQEEMGLGVRVATPLAVKNGGLIENSAAARNEAQVWGKPATWCDYRAPLDKPTAGIAIIPDPLNFRPSWFHARDYGLLVANPFGHGAFTGGEPSRVVVRPGETFRLRFAILVHDDEIDLNAACHDWIRRRSCIAVSEDQRGFALSSDRPFVPLGFNYDHDEQGRLIEDYWLTEWPKVEADFAEMRELGANVVRVHLQFGKFMDGPGMANVESLDQLSRLVELAETTGLYLDLTGLGCYHKQDVPAWYDALSEPERWQVQTEFWQAVAKRCAASPAIFCYDLMNEPVVPGGKREAGDWLGPAFAGKHFVQFITLDQKDRARSDVARAWIEQLVSAIREVDDRHLVTVGLVDWSLDRPGLTSGFVPRKVTQSLDFVCVHLYPDANNLAEASKTLAGFAIGKPVVVEETFPLRCTPAELDQFIEGSQHLAAGWISFYWGKPPSELKQSGELVDAILLQWLERFPKRAERLGR